MENTFFKWIHLWNAVQIVPSALLITSNSFVNLEFHSRLLQELPSAIFGLVTDTHDALFLRFYFLKSAVVGTVSALKNCQLRIVNWARDLLNQNNFFKWIHFWNIVQIVPSALLTISNSLVNLEFHSRLLQELPSAIFGLSAYTCSTEFCRVLSPEKCNR